jgi:hypothetical protein
MNGLAPTNICEGGLDQRNSLIVQNLFNKRKWHFPDAVGSAFPSRPSQTANDKVHGVGISANQKPGPIALDED